MILTLLPIKSQDYKLSNYIKNDQPYFINTLTFVDEAGILYHHNVHLDDRTGGCNKEMMNQLDQLLRDLIDNQNALRNKVQIEHVEPYKFPCSIANRKWIQPTRQTKVIVITPVGQREYNIAA